MGISRSVTTMLAAAASLALIAPGAALAKAPVSKKGFLAADNTLFMVFANPVEGQDVAFNTWYDKHITDIVKLPEFVRAQRFQMYPRKGRADPLFKYVIVYEIKGDSDVAMDALGAAVKRGEAEAPDKRWVLKTEGMTYRAITDLFK